MSRSPWRDALDGQIRVLRELRKPVAAIHLGTNADTPELEAQLPSYKDFVQFQYTYGEALAEGIEVLVRDAEPIFLASDINAAICRTIDRIKETYDRDG